MQWSALWRAASRLPHALLLRGPGGIGKQAFAQALAQRLLCERQVDDPAAIACGQCPACRWLVAGTHPDFRLVAPETEQEEQGGETVESSGGEKGRGRSQQIRIAQIRELEDFVYVGGHHGARRVVLLRPAEAMNAAAANSLLKILEEPPSSVYFILVSDCWRRLLPTIRSRCRQLAFSHPPSAEALQWLRQQRVVNELGSQLLAISGGAPLAALEEHERGRGPLLAKLIDDLGALRADPLAQAAHWEAALKKEGSWSMEQFVVLLQKWLYDLIAMQRAGQVRFFPSQNEVLARLARSARAERLFDCYNQIYSLRALAHHPLNARLFLEELLTTYRGALAG